MKRYRDVAGDGGSNIAGQVEAQQGQLRKRLASVASVVAIVSGKGGVGKSALTANLACCLALDGWKVGVLDADLNGPTQAKILGVRGRRRDLDGFGRSAADPELAHRDVGHLTDLESVERPVAVRLDGELHPVLVAQLFEPPSVVLREEVRDGAPQVP